MLILLLHRSYKRKSITYKIQARTMLSQALKQVTKTAVNEANAIVGTEASRSYTTYCVTKNSHSGDSSKLGHPGVLKEECEASVCPKTTCAKDTSHCDHATKQAYSVGHKTNDSSNIESDKQVVELEDDIGSRGGQAKTVIYSEKEPIDDDAFYDQRLYKETQIVQKDSNTEKLNDATKDLPVKEVDSQDED